MHEWPIGLQFISYLSFARWIRGEYELLQNTEVLLFRLFSIFSSDLMQSGMSEHDSSAYMVMGISLSLFHNCALIVNLWWIVVVIVLVVVVFFEGYMIGLTHLSWIFLPVVCGLRSHLLHEWNTSGRNFLGHVVFLVLLFLHCCSRTLHFSGFCLWVLFVMAMHCWVFHSLGTTLQGILAWIRLAPRPTPVVFVSWYNCSFLL